MSVNSYLGQLASNLVLSDFERESITTSINTLKRRLGYHFTASEIQDKFIFGSYTRRTILPRKFDEKSDIDFMIVFDNAYGYNPQTFLNKLKSFAETYYLSSEIHQSNPTVVLDLNHIKFELVPAYKSCSWHTSYNIPDGPNQWQTTTPKEDDDELMKCNNDNAYMIKPVIRLIKLWNIKKNGRKDCSFEIERKIARNFYFNCTSYSDYLLKSLQIIKTYSNGAKIDNAIAGIKKALEFEQNNCHYSALNTIKEIFPED